MLKCTPRLLRERVAGIDFAKAILERAQDERLRVFLLGGKGGVSARAQRNNFCIRIPRFASAAFTTVIFKRTEKKMSVCSHLSAPRVPTSCSSALDFPYRRNGSRKTFPVSPLSASRQALAVRWTYSREMSNARQKSSPAWAWNGFGA